jgi:hypothetical protein
MAGLVPAISGRFALTCHSGHEVAGTNNKAAHDDRTGRHQNVTRTPPKPPIGAAML